MNDFAKIATEESWHTLDDGEKIYTKVWKADGQPKARIFFLHGFSGHSNTHGLLFPILASKGIEVFSVDQRGWGRSVKSPKQKGVTGPTKQVMADITSVLRRWLPSFPRSSATTRVDNVPLFLMGHSMGGAEVIYHAYQHPSLDIRGYLSMSPWIVLAPEVAPSVFIVMAGRLAAKIMPHMQIPQPLNAEFLSHDEAVCQAAREDVLCHDTATLEQAAGALQRGDDIHTGKARAIGKDGVRSFWVAHGTADQICAFSGAKDWFEKYCEVNDKEFKTYEGWRHMIQDEGPYEAKLRFANDAATWILARSD